MIPEKAEGIQGSAIETDFIVNVRAGGPSSGSHVADDIAFPDHLAPLHGQLLQVSVSGCQAETMLEFHQLSIIVLPARETDYPVGRGNHSMP